MFIKRIAKSIKQFTVKISKWIYNVLFLDVAGNVGHFIVKFSGILAVWVSGIAILISLGIYVIFWRIFSSAH
jgi:hypothetical protein